MKLEFADYEDNDPGPSVLEQLCKRIRELEMEIHNRAKTRRPTDVEHIQAKKRIDVEYIFPKARIDVEHILAKTRIDVEHIRAETQRLKIDMESRLSAAEADYQKLKNDIIMLNIRPIRRGMLLEMVRERMITAGVITSNIEPTSNDHVLVEIVRLVKQGLIEKNQKLLTDSAIWFVFDIASRTTFISFENEAVDYALPDDYIAEAVLDTTLSYIDQTIYIELFVWLKGRQPTLGYNA